LISPTDGKRLTLVDPVERDGRIESGTLVGEDGSRFPIVRGIPRLAVQFRDLAEEQTVRAFGAEWTTFSDHDRHFASPELFREFVPFFDRREVEGRIALDAGCGAGRWTQHLAALGASRVIAVDLSEAVEVCARKVSACENVVVVQGSLLAPPIRRGAIDVAISVGVIHHLAAPAEGLAKIRSLLSSGGGVLAAWLYGYEGNALYLAIFNPLRRLTARCPRRPLLALSYGLTLPLWAWIQTINRWVPVRRDGTPRLPMQTYFRMLEPLSFRDLASVVYDQLTPTLAKYFRRDEVLALVAEAGGEILDLRHRTHNSWCLLLR
jgi:SAM-dependent methyltransferase